MKEWQESEVVVEKAPRVFVFRQFFTNPRGKGSSKPQMREARVNASTFPLIDFEVVCDSVAATPKKTLTPSGFSLDLITCFAATLPVNGIICLSTLECSRTRSSTHLDFTALTTGHTFQNFSELSV